MTVQTYKGRYEAGRLVLTAGPWMADLLPLLRGVAVPDAYSDDVAQSFRLDVAHRSDLISPSVPG